MRTGKYHILFSWVLLICFTAGQYMVYAHRHQIVKGNNTHHLVKNTSRQSVTEKCFLCYVMHHNVTVTAATANFDAIAVLSHTFKNLVYNFTSIQLILSPGRAPPAVYAA